jgi:hypothetical protein
MHCILAEHGTPVMSLVTIGAKVTSFVTVIVTVAIGVARPQVVIKNANFLKTLQLCRSAAESCDQRVPFAAWGERSGNADIAPLFAGLRQASSGGRNHPRWEDALILIVEER